MKYLEEQGPENIPSQHHRTDLPRGCYSEIFRHVRLWVRIYSQYYDSEIRELQLCLPHHIDSFHTQDEWAGIGFNAFPTSLVSRVCQINRNMAVILHHLKDSIQMQLLSNWYPVFRSLRQVSFSSPAFAGFQAHLKEAGTDAEWPSITFITFLFSQVWIEILELTIKRSFMLAA